MSGPNKNFTAVHISNQADIPTYSSDGNAPDSTFYFNTADNLFKYKDSASNVRVYRPSSAQATGDITDDQGTTIFDYSTQEVKADVNNTSTTTDAVDYNSLTPDYRLVAWEAPEETSNQTTTSTNFTTVLSLRGAVDTTDIPTNATLYGRLVGRIKNDTANESTTITARIRDEDNATNRRLTELNTSVTDTSFALADSGWAEITSTIGSVALQPVVQMKVSGGTGEIVRTSPSIQFAAVESTA